MKKEEEVNKEMKIEEKELRVEESIKREGFEWEVKEM